MKIYDCFTFYNELELLEIRLKELYDHVDYFVIAEANQTFTNRSKDFTFEKNQERFTPWLDKIRYIKVEDMPGSTDPWENETHQRNAVLRGTTDAADDDIIIISDCDEILRGAAVDKIRSSEHTIFALRMPLYNFKFNYMRETPGIYEPWPMAARASTFTDITPNTLRNVRFNFNGAPLQYTNNGCEVIEHAGWHFSYLGNNEYLKDKARSWSHQEINTPEFLDQIDLDASIQAKSSWDRSSNEYKYEIVELDSYYPKAITDNIGKYQQYILVNPEAKVLDLLPPYTYNN
jgi:hypothetical protein